MERELRPAAAGHTLHVASPMMMLMLLREWKEALASLGGERERGREEGKAHERWTMTSHHRKVGDKNVLRLWMLDVSASLHVARRD